MYEFGENVVIWSVFLAICLNLLNFGIFLLFSRGLKDKSNKNFLISALGGIGVRMLFILLSFAIVLIFLKIDKYSFIFTFFVIYIFFLVIEIMLLRNIGKKPK
ncbi:MAG: hypothetical protein M0P71_11190 [Melioribacteraceae bacterium]|nr:hypothetical protein [Melioribacteraceae bacterium]